MNSFVVRSVRGSEAASISWASVFAGVVAALGVASLLNLLGIALGLANFSFDLGSVKNLGLAAIIWLIFSSGLSMFVGGWVSGLLCAKLDNRIEYVLHGFLMWSISMIFTFVVATTSVGFAVSGLLGVTQKALTVAGKGAAELGTAMAPQVKSVVMAVIPAENDFIKSVNQQAQDIFKNAQKAVQQNMAESEGAGANSLAQEAMISAKDEFANAIEVFFAAKGEGNTEQAKQTVVNILVEKGDMSKSRANLVVSKWYDRYQSLKEKAQDKAHKAKQYASHVTEKTSSVLSKLALVSLLALLLGAVAACTGAVLGSAKDE